MSLEKASLFRRVSAWASHAKPETVRAYLDAVQKKQETISASQRRALRWAAAAVAVFELCLAAAVGKFSLGPIEVQDLRPVVLALPAVIAYCVSSVIGAAVVHRLLAVSESACVRAIYHTEWMLGIEHPQRHLWGLEDHNLEMWGQPISSSGLRGAYRIVLRLYLAALCLSLLVYPVLAFLRAGGRYGFGQPVLWVAGILTGLALARALFAHAYARGAWDLDDDIPPLAHLMADEQVRAWQEQFQRSRHGPPDSGVGPAPGTPRGS